MTKSSINKGETGRSSQKGRGKLTKVVVRSYDVERV